MIPTQSCIKKLLVIYNISHNEVKPEKPMKNFLLILILLLTTQILQAQFGSQDSGGKILPGVACYDVLFYDINITIDTEDQVIAGEVVMRSRANKNFSKMIVDLDDVFSLESVELISPQKIDLHYDHNDGKIFIALPEEMKEGNTFEIKTIYAGKPRVALNPPWDDGFVWKKSKDGITWASVACQGGGADIWWPCKDYPSDEPDSVSIHLTVPSELVCISNGKLMNTINNNDNTKTWNWFVSTPINNYCVTFYIGPYKQIDYDYTSTTGEKIPFTVWVLPDNFELAKKHSPQFIDHMKIMEELIGPYPFRSDKYSVVEAPYLGMEHQTAIAYGYGWKNDEKFPFDWLHHHEFSHDWWGNMVTCATWNDFWIHEGIGTYMQPLYLEKMFGKKMYIDYLRSIKKFSNNMPVAPRDTLTAGESYNLDIYYKGAWIVHTLRYYLGDEIFFKVLRRWAYPDPEMENIKDGRQCRFATTDELIKIAEKISGKNLDWFFEVYLRHAQLPVLYAKNDNSKLVLWWKTENDLPFNLPVEIKIGNQIETVKMLDNKGEINLPVNTDYNIDPDEWILMDKIILIDENKNK